TEDQPHGEARRDADREAERGRLERREQKLPQRHPYRRRVEMPEARPDGGGPADEERIDEVDDPRHGPGDGRVGQAFPQAHALHEEAPPPEHDASPLAHWPQPASSARANSSPSTCQSVENSRAYSSVSRRRITSRGRSSFTSWINF